MSVAAQPSPRDLERAQVLAEEVRRGEGRRRTWRKVTTLLHLFGVTKLTDNVRSRIGAALEAAGLEVEPPLSDVLRSGTVRLSPARTGAPAPDPSTPASVQPRSRDELGPRRDLDRLANRTIAAWFWSSAASRSERPRKGKPGEAADGEVAWYDVDILNGDPVETLECLEALCPGLELEMIEDLFKADDHPGIESLGDEGRIRAVSTLVVLPWPRVARTRGAHFPRGAEEWGVPAYDEGRPQLSFWIVELLAGCGWVISAWHEGEIRPTASLARPRPMEMEMFVPALVPMRSDGPEDAHDLATILLHQLTLGYADAYRSLPDDFSTMSESELHELRDLVGHFRRQVTEFDRTGIAPPVAWFRTRSLGASDRATQIASLITMTLRELRETDRSIEARLAEIERGRTERFQTLIAGAGGIVLIPTLIASIFGANTAVPGEKEWWGLALLMLLMAASIAVTVFALRRWDRLDGAVARRTSKKQH